MHEVTPPGHMIDACVKGTMKWVPLAHEIWHIEGGGCLPWNKLAPWRMRHTPRRELTFDAWCSTTYGVWRICHGGSLFCCAFDACVNEHVWCTGTHAPRALIDACVKGTTQNELPSVAYASLTHDGACDALTCLSKAKSSVNKHKHSPPVQPCLPPCQTWLHRVPEYNNFSRAMTHSFISIGNCSLVGDLVTFTEIGTDRSTARFSIWVWHQLGESVQLHEHSDCHRRWLSCLVLAEISCRWADWVELANERTGWGLQNI